MKNKAVRTSFKEKYKDGRLKEKGKDDPNWERGIYE